jgi:CRP/FNR family transcriptional regulator, cyclic AMP receptor protein
VPTIDERRLNYRTKGAFNLHFRRGDRSTVPNLAFFSGCDRQELGKIARLGTAVRVEPGRVLTRQGHMGSEFFVVVAGVARCEVDDRVVASFGPGDFFGEMALLDGGPRTATVSAVAPMEVLVFSAAEFVSLVQTSGEVARRVMSHLAARLRTANAA